MYYLANVISHKGPFGKNFTGSGALAGMQVYADQIDIEKEDIESNAVLSAGIWYQT